MTSCVSAVLRVSRFLILLPLLSAVAAAQAPERRFEAAASVAVASTSQFDETEVGIGGRFGWRPMSLFGIEVEMTHYPGDYPDGFAFSRARWEGFFGGTFGPRLGPIRPYARVRPGFLTYREAPESFACITVFPPPLTCTLAPGATVLAIDIGGGIEVSLSDRSFLRVDVGDRALRFEGPVFDTDFRESVDGLWSHGFRLAAGGGVRF
jgi:hypothetical protein